MTPLLRREVGDSIIHAVSTDRADGDLSPRAVESGTLAERRRVVIDLPWHATRQVHSDRVAVVDDLMPPAIRPIGDALVTTLDGVALAMHSGDCVTVGFVDQGGAIGAAHAGWKGLEAGVLESTVRAMAGLGGAANPVDAVIGPHIRAASYEFGDRDLDRLSVRFGTAVRAQTSDGRPALDLTAAIHAELARLGVGIVGESHDCTAELDERYWSHRARREAGRTALVLWRESLP